MSIVPLPSSYNSLQVRLERHLERGLTMTTAYTWGKALGYIAENGENANGIKYYLNVKRNWARTDFDHTQIFVQSYVWDLPFGKEQRWLKKGWGSKIAGGWRFKVTEKVDLESRSEWFSATNTPHFDNPDLSPGDTTFGLVRGAGGARNIDFAMRLMF